VTLADTDNPRRNDTAKAAVSLTPHPPILTGKVIENKTSGAKTKKLIISIFSSNASAQII
jgi:hypothetical protein